MMLAQITDKVSDTVLSSWESFWKFLNRTLFELGNYEITIISLSLLILSFVVLFVGARLIQYLLVSKVLKRTNLNIGTRKTIGATLRYAIIIIGGVVILQAQGVDLSTLSILAGALGVGIGFGLQNLTNNFISGIIILFEQPIKVGDRIELDDIFGEVVEIKARTTFVLTNDNVNVIVPNSEFTSSRVINWSHNDRRIRYRLPIGVSYSSDPQEVKEITERVASEQDGILKSPEPELWFTGYGDSSIDFELLVWTTEYISRPKALRSALYYSIFEAFAEAGIEIPFPQRDLHIRSSWEQKAEKGENNRTENEEDESEGNLTKDADSDSSTNQTNKKEKAKSKGKSSENKG